MLFERKKIKYNEKLIQTLIFKKLRRKPMAASFLPSILVPLVGLVFPAIAMASIFVYIEKDEVI
jgi:photosystem I subunit 8